MAERTADLRRPCFMAYRWTIRLLLTLQKAHRKLLGTIIPIVWISMRTKEFEPDEIADAAMRVFWERG